MFIILWHGKRYTYRSTARIQMSWTVWAKKCLVCLQLVQKKSPSSREKMKYVYTVEEREGKKLFDHRVPRSILPQ